MADDYTPSDEQVEAEWTAFMSTPDPDNYWDGISEEEAQARWSRWLAAHDAQVRRDAARAALGSLQSFARDCMDGKHGEIDHETFVGWHHTWAAAMQHRATHYPHPEETP